MRIFLHIVFILCPVLFALAASYSAELRVLSVALSSAFGVIYVVKKGWIDPEKIRKSNNEIDSSSQHRLNSGREPAKSTTESLISKPTTGAEN
jgi:hypothetical protein